MTDVDLWYSNFELTLVREVLISLINRAPLS